MVIIELPLATSANDIWRSNRGRVHKSGKYTAWIKEAMVMIHMQKPNKIKGGYRMIIEAVKPDNRRRDLSNLTKATEDVLQRAGIVDNDCLCNELISRWVKSGPEMRILLEPYDVI